MSITESADPFAEFAAHQTAIILPTGLSQRVAILRDQIAKVANDPTLRGQITQGVKALAWNVRKPDGTKNETPLLLTLEKEDLIRRIWRQDSSEVEQGRRWIDDAKAVFYCACHGPSDFRKYFTNINALLMAVHDFYAEQITDDAARSLMAATMDALWDGHRITMAVPAPAPIGAHTEGN